MMARISGRQIHQSRGEAHQVVAEQGDARVVEAGHAMEDAVPDGLAEGIVVAEPEPPGQDDRGDHLEGHREQPDPQQQPAHVAQPDGVGFVLRDEAAGQAQPPGGEQPEQRGQRHDAEAADLHQHQQHDVAEGRPVGGRVHNGQTGDARGRDRREQRGEEGRALAHALAGDGQHQHDRADRNQAQEGHGDDPCRMPPPASHDPLL